MTVVFDAASCCAGNVTVHTCAHTTAGVNRYLLVLTSVRVADINTPTYAGANMTQIDSGSLGSKLWELVNPAIGLNNIVVTTTTGATEFFVAGISFTGVNQADPYGDLQSDPTNGLTTQTVTLTTTSEQHVVSLVANNHDGAAGPVAPLTSRANCGQAGSLSGNSRRARIADQPGQTGTTDNVWEFVTTQTEREIYALALNPFLEARGRATKYYFNIWDPKARVRDVNDRVVPPNEIQQDNFIEIQGVKLPEGKVHDTYTTDPTKARIVEVGATERGANMKASRSQFADVIISRAAGGRA